LNEARGMRGVDLILDLVSMNAVAALRETAWFSFLIKGLFCILRRSVDKP
jgi:hypothetical protein